MPLTKRGPNSFPKPSFSRRKESWRRPGKNWKKWRCSWRRSRILPKISPKQRQKRHGLFWKRQIVLLKERKGIGAGHKKSGRTLRASRLRNIKYFYSFVGRFKPTASRYSISWKYFWDFPPFRPCTPPNR